MHGANLGEASLPGRGFNVMDAASLVPITLEGFMRNGKGRSAPCLKIFASTKLYSFFVSTYTSVCWLLVLKRSEKKGGWFC